MRGNDRGHGLGRGIRDFALAFVLFWGASLYLGAAHSPAHASLLPPKPALQQVPAAPAGYRFDQRPQTELREHRAVASPQRSRLLLSVALAAIAAINLGFWRHLRRVYASPRRGVWGRG